MPTPRKSTPKSTPKKGWQPAFLECLADTGSVLRAAKAAKVHRSTAYNHRKIDAAFAAAWVEAEDLATDVMEAEAWRRAVDGTLKPVFHAGEKVGEVREYSNTLIIFLLKARRPEKYRDRSTVEHTGRVAAAAPFADATDADLDAEIKRLQGITAPAAGT